MGDLIARIQALRDHPLSTKLRQTSPAPKPVVRSLTAEEVMNGDIAEDFIGESLSPRSEEQKSEALDNLRNLLFSKKDTNQEPTGPIVYIEPKQDYLSKPMDRESHSQVAEDLARRRRMDAFAKLEKSDEAVAGYSEAATSSATLINDLDLNSSLEIFEGGPEDFSLDSAEFEEIADLYDETIPPLELDDALTEETLSDLLELIEEETGSLVIPQELIQGHNNINPSRHLVCKYGTTGEFYYNPRITDSDLRTKEFIKTCAVELDKDGQLSKDVMETFVYRGKEFKAPIFTKREIIIILSTLRRFNACLHSGSSTLKVVARRT